MKDFMSFIKGKSRRVIKVIKEKWLRETSLTILLVAIIMVIFVVSNLIVSKLDIKPIDFTKEKRISICPYCKREFKYIKGKIYCSKECRENDKHYPSIEEVNE